jgi:hypothetical protein
MKIKYLFSIIISLIFTSCKDFHIVSSPDYKYWLYIDGEKGRKVEISYTERESNPNGAKKNIITTESVTLPYFKNIHYVYEGGFIKVKSANDSTTKIIGWDLDTRLLYKNCNVIAAFDTTFHSQSDSSYCKDLKRDSLYLYLNKTGYKNFKEFKKGDSEKQIQFP